MSMGVIVADDHPIYLGAVCALLDAETKLQVVGSADNGEQAVALARRLRPRLFITDISMPGIGGIEALRQVNALLPDAKTLVLSMHAERRHVLAALDAGANGYLLKDTARSELLHVVNLLLKGHSYLSPAIAGHVVEAYRANHRSGKKRLDDLTGREREVLCLIADGESTVDIATRLGISPKTVGTHREHLMQKLDIHSTAQLARLAVREGLIADG